MGIPSGRAEIVLVEERLLEGLESLKKIAARGKLHTSEDHAHRGVKEVTEHLLHPRRGKHAVPVGEEDHVPADALKRLVEGGLLAGEAVGFRCLVEHPSREPCSAQNASSRRAVASLDLSSTKRKEQSVQVW